MSIFLNSDSRVIVQGITGGEGTKHTALMLKAGTNIVGGVNARKAGTTVTHGDLELPVFGTVAEAMEETGANVSVVFVPAAFTKDAMMEAIDAEIPLLVVITEGVPVQDTAEVWAYVQASGNQTRIIGPNCPGVITPGQCAGRDHARHHQRERPDRAGIEVRHADLPDDVRAPRDRVLDRRRASEATRSSGPPTSTASRHSRTTPRPQAIVMIGEIGGDAEERAAGYIKEHITKPVVGYVAGFTAPEGKTMGHAGAIVSGSSGTAAGKQEALEAAGVKVGKTPSATAQLVRDLLHDG